MRRAVVGLDRAAGLVVGIVLILLGVSGIGWWQGLLLDRVPRVGSIGRSTASGIRSGVGQSWWPWVAGIVGIVLALLGLVWLLRHFTHRGVREYRVRGSDRTGRLTANSGALLSAATDQLTDTRGIRSAGSSMTNERGALVAELSLTADPAADLTRVAADVDRTVADLARALADPAVTYRSELSVARRRRLVA